MNISNLIEGLGSEGSPFLGKLEEIYGKAGLDLQKKRYLSALIRFRELYPESEEVHLSRAGGRLLISGEHLDYHHGQILNTALMEDVVVISSLGNNGFCFANMDSRFEAFRFDSVNDVEVIEKSKKELKWKDYGSAIIKKLDEYLMGVDISLPVMNFLVDGREEFGGVPLGVGLSSSGALEVAIINAALGAIDRQKEISASEISNICVLIESALGFVSGIQDPFGSLMGGNDVEMGKFAQLIDCIPKRDNLGRYKVDSELISLPENYIAYIIRVGNRKITADGRDRHNVRVFEGELGAFLLNKMLWVWIENSCSNLNNNDLISKYNSEIYDAENNSYPPFWKVSYFSDYNLNKIGLLFVEDIIKEWAEFLPKELSKDEIIERYSYLGMNEIIFNDFIRKCKVKNDSNLKYDIRGTVIHILEENQRTLLAARALRNKDMDLFFDLQKETGKSLGRNYHLYNHLSDEPVRELSNLNIVLAARVLGPGSGANVIVWAKKEDEEELRREIERIGEQKLGWKDISMDKRKWLVIKLKPGKNAGLIV
jgi:galactokinase